MNEDWKEKLTGWDTALLHMVENLTGMPCEPKNSGDGYFFEADYSLHEKEPDVLLAIWDAINGRCGERIVEMTDQPERKSFYVRLLFGDGADAPQHTAVREPDLDAGDVWCPHLREVRAVKILRKNLDQLRRFVGNGTFRGLTGQSIFQYVSPSGVVQYAEEGNYLVWLDGRFEQIDADGMEANWEPK